MTSNIPSEILIALGANMPSRAGPPAQTLKAALAALSAAGVEILKVSSFYETAAWPDPADPPFANAAASLQTSLQPVAVLELLHAIETAFGRVRSLKNAPRTLDLDLIFLGQETRATPALRLPHPSAFYRRFVLDPLIEVAPDWVDPVRRITARQLHHRLTTRPFRVACLGPIAPHVVPQLAREFPAADLTAYRSHDEFPFAFREPPGDQDGIDPLPLPALIVDLASQPVPELLRSSWLDLWGHFTTPHDTACDESAAIARLREVLASALGP